ncbi:MAG: VPGUxxT family thioredoxin-like (seleno)protein, type 2 [Patiriisocius sp.]|uniref:VPGUxxT family thioredoxin-like (seleno)protein, type 2 n=1 Tax=Patiriisocius sp. TaxID=2822396 RepID=UPI003EF29C6C
MKHSNFLTVFVAVLLINCTAFAQERTNPKNQDEELGQVSWYRDFDVATSISAKEKKPVFILFQEVPGCATCRNYGHNVMSNPLLVEAISNEFIPLAIFNNKGGKDKEILNKYKEPTWNNPVVRIVAANGENLTQRISGDYSALAVYNAIVDVLEKEGKQIPKYITLLGEELKAKKYGAVKEAQYKMYCFWTGEKQLGSQEGVLETKAGFNSGEVVQVTYDETKISKKQLDAFAAANQMRPVANKSFRWSEKDEDYYLQHSDYKNLNLTELQKTKINSALGNRKDATQYLSPSQLLQLKQIVRR